MEEEIGDSRMRMSEAPIAQKQNGASCQHEQVNNYGRHKIFVWRYIKQASLSLFALAAS